MSAPLAASLWYTFGMNACQVWVGTIALLVDLVAKASEARKG
jgi:hypothetical protein